MFIWQSNGVHPGGCGPWWRYQTLFGVLLVLAGVIIVLYPEILAMIVAGVIILAGLGVISSGLQMRRVWRQRDIREFDTDRW